MEFSICCIFSHLGRGEAAWVVLSTCLNCMVLHIERLEKPVKLASGLVMIVIAEELVEFVFCNWADWRMY